MTKPHSILRQEACRVSPCTWRSWPPPPLQTVRTLLPPPPPAAPLPPGRPGGPAHRGISPGKQTVSPQLMCVILKTTRRRNINLTSCDDMMESTCKNSHNIKHDVIRAHRRYKTGTDRLTLFTQKTFYSGKTAEKHELTSCRAAPTPLCSFTFFFPGRTHRS